MIDRNKYNSMAELVIDELEGGYYHPDMLKDGRVKDSRYASSGETMYGIDRKNGGTVNTNEAGKQFWTIIDGSGARGTWQWNYKGGNLAPQLRPLAASAIWPSFKTLYDAYLSRAAKAIVEKSNRLLFHFIYATWNGAGWFKKFASDINEAVDKGMTSEDDLIQVAIDSRTKEGLKSGSPPNSLIAQTGRKIAGIFDDMPVENSVNMASVGGGFGAIIALIILLSLIFK